MNPKNFYDRLKSMGEFRCVKDLRRFKRRAEKDPRMSEALYLSHFGHCKNGSYHHCEFQLEPASVSQVIYYYKVVELAGEKFRMRGGKPLKTMGRGRPPGKPKKKR